MAASFRVLLAVVIVIGLVMGVGLGALQDDGESSPMVNIQGLSSQTPTADEDGQSPEQATPEQATPEA